LPFLPAPFGAPNGRFLKSLPFLKDLKELFSPLGATSTQEEDENNDEE
jgi:hypothetical protein